MTSFSWLHLSDLHHGMEEQGWLWPNIKEKFFEDLDRLHDKCGPWDLVLFTGDLTQTGSSEEFDKLDGLLISLWEHFGKLGSNPRLLAVPGNHDLIRPYAKKPSVLLLRQWKTPPEVQKDFWEDETSAYRQLIKEAFENYSAWWKKQPFQAENLSAGMLPGDFSVSIKKKGASLGIVGFNTAFLQLTADDYQGRLALHTRQFQKACEGDGPAWAGKHHACILLTHHPVKWLDSESQEQMHTEINLPGRFAIHLCGHMHEAMYQGTAEGGGETQSTWQGRSLFGLNHFSKKEIMRSHGYAAGKIELSGDKGRLLIWPREARIQGASRNIVPDYSLELTDDQHTNPKFFGLQQRYQQEKPTPNLEMPKTGLESPAAGNQTVKEQIDKSIREPKEHLIKAAKFVRSLQEHFANISVEKNKLEEQTHAAEDLKQALAHITAENERLEQEARVAEDLKQRFAIITTENEILAEKARAAEDLKKRLANLENPVAENPKIPELQYWNLLSQQRSVRETLTILEAQKIRLNELIDSSNREYEQIGQKLKDQEARLPSELRDRIKIVTGRNDSQPFHLRSQALDLWDVPGIPAPDENQRRLSRLQAEELARLVEQRRFDKVSKLEGQWLPGLEKAPAPLIALSEVARYLLAAETGSVAYHCLQHLDRAQKSLTALKNSLKNNRKGDFFFLAAVLPETLPVWEKAITESRNKQEELAKQTLPNPFFAGDPLDPEYGEEVFRGRMDVVRQIEALLADPKCGGSIVLLGPRRSGKTSLLKMLPALLPDTVCVFFDLQDNTVESPDAFFLALAKCATEQATRDRQVELPPLPEGPPFEAAGQWLKALETTETLQSAAGDRRILICIDEFELMETLFPGDRRDLLKLMTLFRATIQHRRRVRLLVSGAAPFDELDRMWSDHFINAREFQLDYLKEDTAIELLIRPIPDFPPQAVSLEVAKRIFARTAGQPYLLQLYGLLLISHLNEERRKQAELEDLEVVEDKVLDQAAYYFQNTVESAPKEAREVLFALAEDKKTPMQIDRQTRRWLKRRCLLTDEDGLLIPVLGKWIQECR
ncbi:MAG: AAA family ATPase [Gammaproteobacteria bacterium]|nr:AAA family ATPase [Gammaproteobacteria bacterium]